MKFTEEQLRGIEKQLSHPKGKLGIEIAENMNTSNIQMTIDSINALHRKDANTLLEIGHGNCGHLNKIYNNTKNIKYIGLEISETMKNEAERINKKLMQENDISFHLYDGLKIPFSNDYFDEIFTVNTIYFWEKPLDFINEIYRVSKTNGIVVLTFAQKDFMQKLPFVKNKFNLYDNEDIKYLIKNTKFKIIKSKNKTEKIKSKSGDLVERIYTVVTLQK